MDDQALKFTDSDIRQLVLAYMTHNCCRETAVAFARETGQEESLNVMSMDVRKKIIDLIRNGRVSEAIKLTQSFASGLLEANPDVHYQLKCQEFIELVQSTGPAEALKFAQEELAPFGKQDADLIALLAYPNPAESPVRHYLSLERRMEVALALNKIVLVHQGRPAITPLESIVRTMVVTQQILSEVDKSEKDNTFDLATFLDA